MSDANTIACDVLVVGSGGAGLMAAITARKAGLDVIVAEKEPVFGGTTALSGGQIWAPGNHHNMDAGEKDSRADVIKYLQRETGNYFDAERIDLFLDRAPQMIRFLETDTKVRMGHSRYPDYHQGYEGSSLVRSVRTLDSSPEEIGADLVKRIKPILPQTVFAGIAVGSSVEMKQLMGAMHSPAGVKLIAAKLLTHWKQVFRYGRGEPVVRGRALVALLARTCVDLGIPLWHSSPAKTLLTDGGRVVGAEVGRPGGAVKVMARRAVILAAGGFTKDPERRRKFFTHMAAGKSHDAPTHDGNTGDGITLAEQAGGVFSVEVTNTGAWVPVSVIPGRTGNAAVFPHLIDRQKPGFIAVTRHGRRFTNESGPYHDFVQHLVRANENEQDSYCWLIADRPAMRRYGMGFVKPAPIPYGHHISTGYLKMGRTLADLAAVCEIDAGELAKTVERFNVNARKGVDPDFDRGADQYDFYQGDEAHKPNGNLGPLETGPFFAVKVIPGDLGTFAGVKTDKYSRVLNTQDAPIPGLYAVGNDQRSAFAGTYPGPGATLGPGMTFAFVAARHIAGLEE
jgi:succinate dehydrogenase/fumarate reductase flavoprotein subunit